MTLCRNLMDPKHILTKHLRFMLVHDLKFVVNKFSNDQQIHATTILSLYGLWEALKLALTRNKNITRFYDI